MKAQMRVRFVQAASFACKSHVRLHGTFRREVLALLLLDFAGEETEAQRVTQLLRW